MEFYSSTGWGLSLRLKGSFWNMEYGIWGGGVFNQRYWEGSSGVKNVFFRPLPKPPRPTHHYPPQNLGNSVLFFRRKKLRFARMTEPTTDADLIIEMIIMMVMMVI